VAASEKISIARANRIKNVMVGTFFTQALVSMAIIIRIPEIIDNIGLSENLAIWGTITGLSGAGSMVALVFAHRLVLRFGTTRVTQIGTLSATLIQGLLPLIGNYWIYFLATLLQFFFFSLYNNAANAQALLIQKRLNRVVLGSIHGAWSLGVAVATLISGLAHGYHCGCRLRGSPDSEHPDDDPRRRGAKPNQGASREKGLLAQDPQNCLASGVWPNPGNLAGTRHGRLDDSLLKERDAVICQPHRNSLYRFRDCHDRGAFLNRLDF
jgi:hypothetical protein